MFYFYRKIAICLKLLHNYVIEKFDCLKTKTILLRFLFVIVKKSKTSTHVNDNFVLLRNRYITLQMSSTFLIFNVYLHTRFFNCNLNYQNSN